MLSTFIYTHDFQPSLTTNLHFINDLIRVETKGGESILHGFLCLYDEDEANYVLILRGIYHSTSA